MKKLKPSICILAEKGQEMQYFGQIHENREVERGRSVELISSTPCPHI